MSQHHTFWRNKNKPWFVNAIYITFRAPTLAGVVAGIFMVGAGALVFCNQVIGYLKLGHWKSHAWISFFSNMDALQSWLYQPGSWIGLSRVVRTILEWMPLSVGLVIMGFPVALFIGIVHANIAATQFNYSKPTMA